MEKNMEERQIVLTTQEGESISLLVMEETKINGINYLLVTGGEDDEECYILKDLSKAEEQEALYEFVEEEQEMDYLYKIFAELLEDMDVELSK